MSQYILRRVLIAIVMLFGISVINFLIVAACIFMVIKSINRLKREKPPTPVAVEPSREEKLLAEIRDALVARR